MVGFMLCNMFVLNMIYSNNTDRINIYIRKDNNSIPPKSLFMNMKKRTIVALPGDGIGRVVLEETIRVLDKAGFNAGYVEGDIGWEYWISEGNPLPRPHHRPA